jgi:hypothetical protein
MSLVKMPTAISVNMLMLSYPIQPQSIRQLLTNSFRLYAQTFKKYWLYSLIASLFIVVLPGLLNIIDPLIFSSVAALWAIIILLLLLSIIITPLISMLLYIGIESHAMGNRLPMTLTVKWASKKWLSILGVAIIVLLLINILSALIGLVIAVPMIVISSLLQSPLITVVSIITLTLLGIAAFASFFFFIMHFSCTIPSILFDNQKVFPSIASSFKLVAGNGWRITWIYFIIYLITCFTPSALSVGFLLILGNDITSLLLHYVLFSLGFSLTITSNLVVFRDLKVRQQLKQSNAR